MREEQWRKKGKIKKGLVSHTKKFEFYPKGNQMQLKSFKLGCGMIRFAFWKNSTGSFRKEKSGIREAS